MAKTILLTQKQLNEIIAGTGYFSDSSASDVGLGSDESESKQGTNIYSNEISVTGGGVKHPQMPTGKPVTSDDIEKMEGEPTNFWPGARSGTGGKVTMAGIPIGTGFYESYSKRDFEKKMLQELNDQLAGVEMTAAVPNPSDPTNPTLITGDENKLSTDLARAKQSGDKLTANAIQKTLDAKRGQIKAGKELRSKVLGMNNQYQKAGGTRNTGGKAHSQKNDSMVQIIDNNQ